MALQALKILAKSTSLKHISSNDRSLLLSKYAFSLANSGQFDESLKVLYNAKSLFPVKEAKQASQEWIRAAGLILFDNALNRGDFKNARCIVDQWGSYMELDSALESTVVLKRALLQSHLGKPAEVYFVNLRLVRCFQRRSMLAPT